MRNIRVIHVIAVVAAFLVGMAWLVPAATKTYASPLAVATEVPTNEPSTPVPTTVPTTPPIATPSPAPTNPAPTATPRPVSPTSKPANADPFIVKTASQGMIAIGEEMSFTLTVGNRGEAIARDVTVSDTLPGELDVLNASASRGSVSVSGQTIQLTIGDLAPGDQVTVQIRVRMTERARPPGFVNSATVTTSTPGDDPNNNTSTVYVGLRQPEPSAVPATPVAPTDVPMMPTPVPPATLPNTGESANWASLLLAVGAILGVIGLVARKYARSV